MVEATTTVTRDAHYYDMGHKNQGFAYIFSHDEFRNSSKRNAADVDEKNLKNLLIHLKFDVRVFKNLKVAEIKDHINEVQQKDHKNNNCFLLFVLTHGGENILEALDGTYDPSQMFWNQFTAENCPTLAGKPKLFFMQCCRGEKLDPGITLKYMPRTETDGHPISYTIPNHSDFCIMYATCKDHFAFRNDKQGSYFVKFFCEELGKYAYEQHLLTILTFVIRRVAVEVVSKCREVERDKKKQTPHFESSLTRLLQFENNKKEE